MTHKKDKRGRRQISKLWMRRRALLKYLYAFSLSRVFTPEALSLSSHSWLFFFSSLLFSMCDIFACTAHRVAVGVTKTRHNSNNPVLSLRRYKNSDEYEALLVRFDINRDELNNFGVHTHN